MNRKTEIVKFANGVVHLIDPFGGRCDTLCSWALDQEEPDSYELSYNQKVTCKECKERLATYKSLKVR